MKGLIVSVWLILLLVLYLRDRKMKLLESYVDFSTMLAQDSVNTFSDFEDMSGMTQELLNQLLKSQEDIKLMMEHSTPTKQDTFLSSNVKGNVQALKNQITLHKTDEQLSQIQQMLENLNDVNPSVAELIGKYGPKNQTT